MACCSRSSTGLVCWRRGAGSSPAGRSFLQEQRVNGLKAINSAPSKLGKAKKPKTNTKPKKKTHKEHFGVSSIPLGTSILMAMGPPKPEVYTEGLATCSALQAPLCTALAAFLPIPAFLFPGPRVHQRHTPTEAIPLLVTLAQPR